MRYISTFSGIEAASVAWEPLGWEAVAFSEIDPFPSAVLAERFPETLNLGDITGIDWSPYRGTIDIIVGGSPCQSFSIAGGREGLDGESRLMYEYIRSVADVRPRWFLWENVPGALTADKGRAFGILLDEMESLGYSLAWRVLDAQFFGVAQRRRRLFVVGHLGNGAAPAAVLFERESVRGNTTSSVEKRKALAPATGNGVEGAITQYGDEIAGTLRARQGGATPDNGQNVVCAGFKWHQGTEAGSIGWEDEQSPTITADWHVPAVCMTGWGNRPQVGKDVAPVLTAHDAKTSPIVLKVRGGCGEYIKWDGTRGTSGRGALTGEDVAFTVAATQDQTLFQPVDFRNGTVSSDVSGTLQAKPNGGYSLNYQTGVTDGYIVRRLTPRECERLQGFPDDWTLIPYRGKPREECPDSPRYKALGNSMAVPVMRWLGERIEAVDALLMERGMR